MGNCGEQGVKTGSETAAVMLGSLSKESVERCAGILNGTGVFSFTRCERPDGTFYGTGGTCRLGNKVGPREDADNRILTHFQERSYALPETSFTGEDIGKMLNDAAKLDGEAGENFRKIQDFILKDGQALIVAQSMETIAERVGAAGVRELNAKDVPWSVSQKYMDFLKKAGVPRELFDRIEFSEDRIKQNKKLEAAIKPKAEKEKQSNDALGYKAYTVQQGMLKTVRKQMRDDKDFLKDLPRRLSSFSLAAYGVDGSTSSHSRIIKITDDPANLNRPFDKSHRADPKVNQENWGKILEARRNLNQLEGREKVKVELDTFAGGMGIKSRNEGVLATYTHEMGHQMYFRAGSPNRPLNVNYPSEYAKLNSDELFAESFSAYSFNPAALKSYDEGLYKWVDSTVNTAIKNAGGEL